MSLWTRLFGEPPSPPTPPPVPPDAPFQDRPPARRVLYYVQTSALPSALRNRRADVLAADRLDEATAGHLWATATIFATVANAIPIWLGAVTDRTRPDAPAAELLRGGVRTLTRLPVHTYRRDALTAMVLVMPPPEYAVESYFVGVVYRGDWPAADYRYFTLERVGDGSVGPWLCEWTADGRHVNLDHEMAPDLVAFAAEVLGRAS